MRNRHFSNSSEHHSKLKDELREYALGLTCLKDAVKATHPVAKVVWIATTVFSFVWCSYCVSLLVFRLIANPTATSIRGTVGKNMQFPIVTICTYARINMSYTKSMNISEELLSYLFSTFKGIYFNYNTAGNQLEQIQTLENQYADFLERQRHQVEGEAFSVVKFFMKAGVDCRKFLSACMFQGSEFDCCEHAEEVISNIGKCFKLKTPSKNDQGQIIPGPQGGLKVYISNWGMSDLYPEAVINTTPDEGMQVHIVHPNLKVAHSSSPLTLLPNTHVMLRLKAKHGIFLETRNEDTTCRRNDTKRLKYFPTYTLSGCYAECLANKIIEKCGCVQIGQVPMAQLDQNLICDPLTATTCVQPAMQRNDSDGFLNNLHDSCHCTNPCHEWSYDMAVSYSRVPSLGFYAAWLKHAVEKGRHKQLGHLDRDSYVLLDVFYDSFVHSVSTQNQLYTFQLDFISTLGGQLSAWLGIRFVTLVQLFYYAALFFLYYLPYEVGKIVYELIGFQWNALMKPTNVSEPVLVTAQPAAPTDRRLHSIGGNMAVPVPMNHEIESNSRIMKSGNKVTLRARASPSGNGKANSSDTSTELSTRGSIERQFENIYNDQESWSYL